MRSYIKKNMIRMLAGFMMVCMLFPMLPAAAAEEVCTCEPVEGVHAEACPLYKAPDAETTEPSSSEEETTEPESSESSEPESSEPSEPESSEPSEPESSEPSEPESSEPSEPESSEPSEPSEPEDTEGAEDDEVADAEDEEVEQEEETEDKIRSGSGEPAMAVTFDGKPFPENGEYENWDYTVSKPLVVSLSGLSQDTKYQVTIELDEAILFKPVPKAPNDKVDVVYIKNDGLPVIKQDGTMGEYIHNDSGTVVYTFTPDGSEMSIPVNLMYDVTLWDQLKESKLRWSRDGALVKVTLSSIDAGTGEKTLISEDKLDNATAARTLNNAGSLVDAISGVDIYLHGLVSERDTFYPGHSVHLMLRAYNGTYYHEYMVIEVDLPKFTYNGTEYCMAINHEATERVYDMHKPYGDNANTFKIFYDTDENGVEDKTRATIHIPYIQQSKSHALSLILTFPEEMISALEAEQSYQLDYKATYSFYSDVKFPEGKTFATATKEELEAALASSYVRRENVTPTEGGAGSFFLRNVARPELKFVRDEDVYRHIYFTDGYATVGWNAGGERPVDSLGSVMIANYSSQDATNVKVEMLFDENNTNAIGVTTINLPTDIVSEYFTVEYSMVDDAGNVYYGTIDRLKNPHKDTKTAGHDRFITLHRGMLENTEHRGLYFKSITYTLGAIEENIFLGMQNSGRSRNKPGSFWGYALKLGEDGKSVEVTSKVRVSDAAYVEGSGQAAQFVAKEFKVLTTVIGNDFKPDKSLNIVLNTGITGFRETEILAGSQATLDVQFYLEDRVTGQTHTYMDAPHIGVELPPGVEVSYYDTTLEVLNASNASVTPITGIKPIIVDDDGNNVTRQIPLSNGNTLWIIEFPNGYPIGMMNEKLAYISERNHYRATIVIKSSSGLSDKTLLTKDTVVVAAKGLHATYSPVVERKTYDLNGDGKASDVISKPTVSLTDQLIIRGNNVSMNITDKVLVNDVAQTGNKVAIQSADDDIVYRVAIENNNGGYANSFATYINIPQAMENGNGDKIVLAGEAMIDSAQGTELMVLYTTEPAANTDAVKKLSAAAWRDASQIGDANDVPLESVTWVKIVSKGNESIKNGTKATLNFPLKYLGSGYSYNAGAHAKVNIQGDYQYIRGSFSLPIMVNTTAHDLSIHYTSAVEGEVTLTAAMEGNVPDGKVNEWFFGLGGDDTDNDGLDLMFHNPQTFVVKNLEMYNVELVSMDPNDMKSMSSADSNKKYMIMTGLTSGGTAVLDGATVGTLEKDKPASFYFKLYNGNILTTASTQRYVTFELTSEYVTIPVKINIQQELTLVEAGAPAIMAGKQYLLTNSNTSVITISQDSAFTAQFVAEVHSYCTTRTLEFENALPANTTIVLIDYTVMDTPRYARYVVSGTDTKSIPLTAFTMMGSGTEYSSYSLPAGQTAKEQMLFVVDYPDSGASDNKVKLKIDTDGTTEAILTDSLEVKVADTRKFSAAVSSTEARLGSEFTLTATVESAGAEDSKYSERQVAFVIDGSNVPADGKLTVDGVEYKRGSDNRYIIPLGDAQKAGTYTRTLAFEAASLANGGSCALDVELWVSATAAAGKPMMGKAEVDGLSITLSSVRGPSVSVERMDKRVLEVSELSKGVKMLYGAIGVPEGGALTIELQKQTGSAYVTDTLHLTNVEGSESHVNGVYTLPNTGIELNINFSPNMETGNYRFLFKVTDSDGNLLLEVPYRFVVVE